MLKIHLNIINKNTRILIFDYWNLIYSKLWNYWQFNAGFVACPLVKIFCCFLKQELWNSIQI